MKGLTIPEGTTVYIPAVRRISKGDSESSVLLEFCCDSEYVFNDDFLTEEELKAKFNEGFPKQGEVIDVRDKDSHWCDERKFICMYKGRVLAICDGEIEFWDEWRFPPQKTELTLAEVEERLGLDAGSLIIK